MSVELLVNEFRQAVAAGRQDDAADHYQRIHQACQPTVLTVSIRYRFLGTFVADIADEKLHQCLETFASGNFTKYYSVSLGNAANSEIGRRKKCESTANLEEKETSEGRRASSLDADELQDQLNCYARRKRNLIDQLNFRSRLKISTLLLDQRQKMAKKTAALVDAHQLGVPSVVVERLELWHDSDQTRLYNGRRQPCLQEVWTCFAQVLNVQPIKQSSEGMVAAIEQTGGTLTYDAWRQQICRYLHDVRDQVSELEWKLFHA